MDTLIKRITSLLIGPLMVFAIYVAVYGHVLPGEGFDSGMLIASCLILCIIIFGREEARKRLNLSQALILSAFAGLVLIAIGLAGLLGIREGHRYLFDNFLPQGDIRRLFSGGIVPVCNVVLAVIVGAGFYALFGYLVVYRREK